MYENWVPTLEYPILLEQVQKDLLDTLSIPGETIDCLTGKDTKEKVRQILLAYTEHVRREYQNEIVDIVSRAVGTSMVEVVKPLIRKMMPQAGQFIYISYQGLSQGLSQDSGHNAN